MGDIVTDIMKKICLASVPRGRFLEFDENLEVWYDVGVGAIPCQRVRMGLLGLTGDSTISGYNADRPIVTVSRIMRARTMKALHFSEKRFKEAVVNLNDDRFKLRESALFNDQDGIERQEI